MDYKDKYLKYKNKYLSLKNKCIIINQKGSGGSESYCYLCGAPISTKFNSFTFKNFKKYKKYFDKIYKKYSKGGYSSNQYPYFSEDSILEWIEKQKHIPEKVKKDMENDFITLGGLSKDNKKYKWMDDLLLLHWSGMILEIVSADSWISQFTDKFGVTHSTTYGNHIVHRDCYKVTKLKYGDYTSLNKKFHVVDKILSPWNFFDYGFINDYDSQEYNWLRYFYYNKDYVLESPLKNAKNKKRILNINHRFSKKINPYFIDFLSVYKINNKIITDEKYEWMKNILRDTDYNLINKYMEYLEKVINKSLPDKKKERPSPSESATKFKVGTKKKGNDLSSVVKPGQKWCLCEYRWNQAYKDGKAPRVIKSATNMRTKKNIVKNIMKGGNKDFLYNPNNPKKSFDVYIDKNPKDTIPIKYKSLKDVKDTIIKLEKLYKNNKYSHKRIWQVGMIMMVRLRVIKDKKSKQFSLAKRYFNFLGKRSKLKDDKQRKNLIFKY